MDEAGAISKNPVRMIEQRRRRLVPVVALAAAWTLLLGGLVVTKATVLAQILSVVVGLAGVYGAFFDTFLKLRKPTRHLVAATALALLAVDVFASAAWGSWSLYRNNRAIDVTALVSLKGNDTVYPVGDKPGGVVQTASLDVDVNHPRRALVLDLAATDAFPTRGSCVPNTDFDVVVDQQGNEGPSLTVVPGVPVRIPLAPGTRHVHLEISVRNLRSDHNCAVRISAPDAELVNS